MPGLCSLCKKYAQIAAQYAQNMQKYAKTTNRICTVYSCLKKTKKFVFMQKLKKKLKSRIIYA